jgi:hypothetical protein
MYAPPSFLRSTDKKPESERLLMFDFTAVVPSSQSSAIVSIDGKQNPLSFALSARSKRISFLVGLPVLHLAAQAIALKLI